MDGGYLNKSHLKWATFIKIAVKAKKIGIWTQNAENNVDLDYVYSMTIF
jgi:hypothetical protein